MVPWVVSVFPTYLPWLHRKFRYLLLKLCNGSWLWQSEETLSHTSALLVWYRMDWFWSLSFLLRSCFQSQVEWGCGNFLLLMMDHVSFYLYLSCCYMRSKELQCLGREHRLHRLCNFSSFWLLPFFVCFMILLWSLFEVWVISPSLILKIMDIRR